METGKETRKFVHVTKHAEQRARKRIGIPKKAVQSIADNAFFYGSLPRKSGKTYRNFMCSKHSEGDAKLYRGFMFIFVSNRLVTVLDPRSNFVRDWI